MTRDEVNLHLLNAQFRFAKSMPEIPHWYTLRETWNDQAFVEVAKYIRQHGRSERFGNKTYIYYYLNGYKYWTMGCPLHNCPKTGTILINKAQATYRTPYNKIANVYDSLFKEDEYIQENKEVIDMIQATGHVLDIGCGTGLFLDYTDWPDYTGIDISHNMIQVLKDKHPHAEAYTCSYRDFCSFGKVDTIIALYGVASYLSPEELKDIERSDADRIFLMAYKEGYFPKTYQMTNIRAMMRNTGNLGLKKQEYHNYIIYSR